jgi:hypothetical protein
MLASSLFLSFKLEVGIEDGIVEVCVESLTTRLPRPSRETVLIRKGYRKSACFRTGTPHFLR